MSDSKPEGQMCCLDKERWQRVRVVEEDVGQRGEPERKPSLTGNTGHSVDYTSSSRWLEALSEGALAKDDFRVCTD